MNEIWKDIPEYEGLYQVSNLGRVKSMERKIRGPVNGILRTKKEKILKACTNSHGYVVYILCVGNKRKTKMGHSLVCEAFLGKRDKGLHIDHRDGIKHNNELSNLEYVTAAENTWRGKSGSKYPDKTSQHRYITYNKGRIGNYKWCSQIRREGKLYRTNYVATEEQARKDFDKFLSHHVV